MSRQRYLGAFDGISRSCLFSLFQLGISHKFCKSLEKLYDNTRNCVFFNQELSDWFSSEVGVKQGCILSPLLFSLYISDLPESIAGGISIDEIKVNALFYADDIVLISESQMQLQLMIDYILFVRNGNLKLT